MIRYKNKLINLSSDPGDHVGKYHAGGNFYELTLLEKIASYNIAGNYLDIGAHVGNHSVYFSNFTDCKFLVAVEADPGNYSHLSTNLRMNAKIDYLALCMILSDRFKRVIPRYTAGNSGMTKFVDSAEGFLTVPFNYITPILFDVIKIDVEGMELEVLRGLSEQFNYCKLISVETENPDVFDYLYAFGYECDNKNYAKTPTYLFTK